MYFIQLNSKTILKIPHVKIRYVLIVDTNLVTLANRVIINKLCKCLILNCLGVGKTNQYLLHLYNYFELVVNLINTNNYTRLKVN